MKKGGKGRCCEVMKGRRDPVGAGKGRSEGEHEPVEPHGCGDPDVEQRGDRGERQRAGRSQQDEKRPQGLEAERAPRCDGGEGAPEPAASPSPTARMGPLPSLSSGQEQGLAGTAAAQRKQQKIDDFMAGFARNRLGGRGDA